MSSSRTSTPRTASKRTSADRLERDPDGDYIPSRPRRRKTNYTKNAVPAYILAEYEHDHEHEHENQYAAAAFGIDNIDAPEPQRAHGLDDVDDDDNNDKNHDPVVHERRQTVERVEFGAGRGANNGLEFTFRQAVADMNGTDIVIGAASIITGSLLGLFMSI